jgi:hypothetical protein
MVTVISGSPFVTLTLTLSDGVFSFPTITGQLSSVQVLDQYQHYLK